MAGVSLFTCQGYRCTRTETHPGLESRRSVTMCALWAGGGAESGNTTASAGQIDSQGRGQSSRQQQQRGGTSLMNVKRYREGAQTTQSVIGSGKVQRRNAAITGSSVYHVSAASTSASRCSVPRQSTFLSFRVETPLTAWTKGGVEHGLAKVRVFFVVVDAHHQPRSTYRRPDRLGYALSSKYAIPAKRPILRGNVELYLEHAVTRHCRISSERR